MQPPAASNQPNSGGKPVSRSLQGEPKRVALIGASVRAAAESAKRGGFTVTGLDRFGDSDTINACHEHLLLEEENGLGTGLTPQAWAAIARIGSQIPILPVGGLADSQQWLDRVPLLKPWLDQRAAASRARDLSYLREMTAGTSIAIPPTDPKSLSSRLSAHASLPSRWLRKKHHSSGGLGTRWNRDPSDSSPCEIWQQWVEGRAFGASILSSGTDSVLLGVCSSRFTRKGHFPFVYSGSLGPIGVPESVRRELDEFGRRIALTSGLRGLFNVDFIWDRAGPCWLLEINPRWSGSSELVERLLRRRRPELSLMSLAIDGLNGSAFAEDLRHAAEQNSDDPIYLKRIVFAKRRFPFERDKIEPLLRPNETLHDTPAEGRMIESGEPVCTSITELVRTKKEKDPMHRHRILVGQLSRGGKC